MTTLVERIVAVGAALDRARIPWAFGGALALAFATAEPRGTRDIDVNVFIGTSRAADVFDALPVGVEYTNEQLVEAQQRDQVRLWWGDTPIDVFFAAEQFHFEVDTRCRSVRRRGPCGVQGPVRPDEGLGGHRGDGRKQCHRPRSRRRQVARSARR